MTYGYPKIELWISKIQHDFWISKNVFLDIHNCIFWISKNELWISKNQFMDILKYISGYPKLFCDILNSFLDIQK